MDSLQSPPNDQCHKDDIVALMPGPMAVKARPGGPTRDPDDQYVSAISPQLIDVTAEETCPAVQMSAQDGAPQLASAVETAQAPSATTFELMSELEALASDLSVRARPPFDQCIGNVHEESKLSSGLQAVEPSIRVSPRPIGFESDHFASDRPSTSRRKVLALASLAALICLGVMVAWHSHGVWTMKQPNDVDVAAEQRNSAPAGRVSTSNAALPQSVPVTQTATAPVAPATSPELVKQLEAMTQDLASVRRGVEELAAKQERLAAAQQQLEQLAAKQEQMAQNIAKLQALGQNARLKMSPSPQPRAVPIPPRAPPEPAAQLSSVSRSAPHPVPPLPVPP